jgi:hypothetical protein
MDSPTTWSPTTENLGLGSALIELLAAHQSDNVDDITVYTNTIDAKIPKPDLGSWTWGSSST